jgi:hypothetical protein
MNGTVRLGQFLFRAEEASPSPVSPSLIRTRPAKVSNVTYSGAVAWRFAMARPGQERALAKDGFTDRYSNQPGRTDPLEGWRDKATEVRLVVKRSDL